MRGGVCSGYNEGGESVLVWVFGDVLKVEAVREAEKGS